MICRMRSGSMASLRAKSQRRTSRILNYKQRCIDFVMDAEKGRLWARIGKDQRDERELRTNDGREQNEENKVRRSNTESRSSQASHQGYIGEESRPTSNSQLFPQPPFAPASIQYPRASRDSNYPPIYQQQSFIQQIIQFPSTHTTSLQLCQLPEDDLSQLPESVTPLVYSKNSKRQQGMRFGKEAARVIMLKLKVADAKETLQKLREEFFDFLMEMREEQQQWQKQICSKYTELEREYSMRVQQSIFLHKQDCQQLKYEMEIFRSRQETFRNPVDSRIVLQKEEDRHFEEENEQLKMQIISLKAENQRLAKEGLNFKQKIVQIEAKTTEVRQSNDKLYEYVFDLEQKIAFYKEQLPKIAISVRQQTRKQLQLQMQQQNEQYYAQINQVSDKNIQLQQQFKKRQQQLQTITQNSNKAETLIKELQVKSSKLQEMFQKKQKQIQKLQKDYELIQQQNRKLKAERNHRERQQYEREEQRRQSSSRISRQYSLKTDKKALQALQIQKFLLQKENLQLKASLQYQKQSSPQFIQLKPHISAPQFTSNYPDSYNYMRDKQIEQKERELLDLQNYLQSQTRKIQIRQRDIETEYVIKRTQQNKLKEYTNVRQPSHDEYGMRKISVQPGRATIRPNNFCSPQAQAIIQNVKLRQKLKETACTCNLRVCRCELSRGSRTSQDSNSREYRMQPHRPSNYSPVPNYQLGHRREEKSSKMKMIQEKVKRLKSELKTSLSSMNN